MAQFIKGITVILYEKTKEGVDTLNRPVYTETPVEVENVLVSPATDSVNMVSSLDLTGRRMLYTLGIPKGDTHTWEDSVVEFFGRKFRTEGAVTEGIEAMVPLDWHRQIKCGVYDG